ncbi:adenylate/guanylate cyclase domain-containing protein [Hellea balneolensis]|uniref:adenylate/guanylate cyclase domain-containing protein n=1 Tax=Hellea balneolensis TaxID=287478 RepID=UPI0004131A94|nr:adenylate/guanylate cyclase domain-containing protein [Hellea balneolensis]
MLNAGVSESYNDILEHFRAGYYFMAFDEAMAALKDNPNDVSLKHISVLSLLRGGALKAAETLFKNFELAKEMHEDILALSGRIIKGRIEEKNGPSSPSLYADAATLYEQTYEQTRGGYSGVNAASLWYMAGDKKRARHLAQTILRSYENSGPELEVPNYYFHATRAECLFLLENEGAAASALKKALEVDPDNHAARATTIKQFKMLGYGELPTCARPLQIPPCVHYTGHLFYIGEPRPERSLTAVETKTLSDEIKQMMERSPSSLAFGALAAGADILFAEGFLDRGVDLHLVLPVPIVDFKRLSVTPMGSEWAERFEAIIPQAKSIRIILDDPGDFDALDLRMGSLIAMGLTRLTAERLSAGVQQFSVMDKQGQEAHPAGTQLDTRLWHDSGGETQNIDWPHPRQDKPTVPLPQSDRRAFRAMLFTDLKGYGGLPDRSLPDIVSQIFEPMAQKCRTLNVQPLHIKSWGDGLFLVFETPLAAAEAAFEIMDSFNESVAAAAGGKTHNLSLRIGIHFGPVWERPDPFTQTPNLYGRHVTTAARLEALAVPGSICVSENFAAMLAMQGQGAENLICDYAGRMKSEKEETVFSLYSLRQKIG